MKKYLTACVLLYMSSVALASVSKLWKVKDCKACQAISHGSIATYQGGVKKATLFLKKGHDTDEIVPHLKEILNKQKCEQTNKDETGKEIEVDYTCK